VPVDHVVAIYARENGQGMAFPVPTIRPSGRRQPSRPAAETHAATATPLRGLRLASTEARRADRGRPTARMYRRTSRPSRTSRPAAVAEAHQVAALLQSRLRFAPA
jgi:stringent starvation protein B